MKGKENMQAKNMTLAKSDYFNALSDYNISIARLERAMGVREVPP